MHWCKVLIHTCLLVFSKRFCCFSTGTWSHRNLTFVSHLFHMRQMWDNISHLSHICQMWGWKSHICLIWDKCEISVRSGARWKTPETFRKHYKTTLNLIICDLNVCNLAIFIQWIKKGKVNKKKKKHLNCLSKRSSHYFCTILRK